MSVIVDGKKEEIPGLRTVSWLDPGGVRSGSEDRRPRKTRWIRSLFLHTTVGDEPQRLVEGRGPSGMAARTIRRWAQDPKHSGAHGAIDGDGVLFQCADFLTEAGNHAKSVNDVCIGIECCQSRGLEVWSATYDSLMRFLDWGTARFGIQRQYQWPYRGEAHPVGRLASGGKDAVGIFGHRDQTIERGPGDPGDQFYYGWLRPSRYEAFDFERERDKDAWKFRQHELGLVADGIPGPRTVAALKAVGKKDGMWVSR